jgi:hypothetical protein
MVLALAIGFTGQGLAQFETRVTIPVDPGPVSVAVGDFNHDGRLDVAVVGVFGSDAVQVLLGKGDGTFEPPVSYSVGSGPVSIVASDVNHDGDLDLATSNAASNSVSILLGNGDGTFQPATNFPTRQDPISILIGDFNGDGKLDVATLNVSDSTGYCDCVAVLLGNGDGSFQELPIITTLPHAPQAFATGLFNADNKLDLAATVEFGGTSSVQILLGNGDGTFQLGASYPVGASPNSIAVADFNHDRKLDLAVAENEGVGVGVLLGNGDGTFQPRVDYPANYPFWVAAADFNLDGNADLVVADLDFPSGVTVLTGNGDGTFQKGVYYADGKEDRFVAVGDFNGDHMPDIVVPDYLGGDVIVLLNTGVASFSPNTPIHVPPSPPQTVTLTNTGTTALTISSISATPHFRVNDTCGASVAPGANCAINLAFETKTTPQKGTVTIVDSASSRPQFIDLSSTSVSLSPSPMNFQPQLVGTTSPPQQLSVTNRGNVQLIFSQIYVSGTDAKDFSIGENTNCFGTEINPGATCTVSVAFKPTKKGPRTATIFLIDNGLGSPETATLTGTGN